MAAITISVYICLVTDISQYTFCLNLIVGSANEKKIVDMPVMEQDYVEQCCLLMPSLCTEGQGSKQIVNLKVEMTG